MNRTRCFQTALLLAASALLAPGAQAKEKKDKGPNFVQAFLDTLTIGPGQVTDSMIIFPLVAKEKPERLTIQPDTWAQNVGYSEPDLPRHRFDLAVASNEPKPLLLLGGTILGGGTRDRVVPQDVLIEPGARVDIRTIPSAPPSGNRKTAVPFRLGSALAAPYIRERAAFSPSNTLVPNFVSHFLDFRNDGDKRKSLSALNASTELNKLCLPCHQSLASFPMGNGGRVVGMITVMRGRIRSLEAFGDNRLFKAWFEPLLKSHTFAHAAIAAKAKGLRMPLPGKGNPTRALAEARTKAAKLLASVQKAKYREDEEAKGSIGEGLILRTPNSTRGAAIAWKGRLLHVAVFPYEPFEAALFRSRLRSPTDPKDGYGDQGESDLARRARLGGRLTEYEKRLLGRMRARNGTAGGLRRR